MVAQSSVLLINKSGSVRTGIGRYAKEIRSGLELAGMSVFSEEPTRIVPRRIASLGLRFGFDLDQFTSSYPLRTGVVPASITHLTSQTLGTLMLTQRLPRPVVITVHDILPFVLRDDPELSVYPRRSDRIMDSLAMRGLRKADRLIADSHFTQSTLVDKLGIDSGKIDVIHLGVDTTTFRRLNPTPAFMNRFGLPTEKSVILFVGSEDPRKNVRALLRAFARVHGERQDTILVKVGAAAFAEERERNLALCDELGIRGSVFWVDEVTEDELQMFYSLASVFAFPSRFEGFGFPVLEAMACGTPVVASCASSIPELAGEFATLVDPMDPVEMAMAIVTILSGSRPDSSDLVNHARSFSWDKSISLLMDTYQNALQSHARAR